MIQTSLEFTGGVTFGTSKTFEAKFNRVIEGMGNDAVRFIRRDIDDSLNAYPGPVRKPIEWTSDKQRKAFFASDGFGRGIPTRRSGKALQWVLLWDKQGQAIKLYNPVAYAKFLWGGFGLRDYQQRFHRNTGYPSARVVRDKAFEKANDYLQAVFVETLEAFSAFTTNVRTGGTRR